jgi:hypothetical protein
VWRRRRLARPLELQSSTSERRPAFHENGRPLSMIMCRTPAKGDAVMRLENKMRPRKMGVSPGVETLTPAGRDPAKHRLFGSAERPWR